MSDTDIRLESVKGTFTASVFKAMHIIYVVMTGNGFTDGDAKYFADALSVSHESSAIPNKL